MTLSDHLNQFYRKHNIPANGGVDDNTFEVPLPFFKLILPNLSWRKKMLHIHDLEHILNEQDTTWKGEMFIASWEISTGFWRNFPVIIFPLWTMGWGLWKHPRTVFRGFRKGQSDTGIAKLDIPRETLMILSLTQLQALTLNKQLHYSSWLSNLKLCCWGFISQIIFFFPLILVIFVFILVFL